MNKINFTPVGAIFDVDDTLLNNYPDVLDLGLHEQARLMAVREIGQERGITQLAETTVDQNNSVIRRALEHSIEGSVWRLFYELNVVNSPIIDHDNELLNAVVKRKHDLYDPILKSYGSPLPNAVKFVKSLSMLTNNHVAIASGSQKENVLAFLRMSGLIDVFSHNRIICRQDFENAKPDPESFATAFHALDLDIEQASKVVAFEDDPQGIESAKRAGLYVCAITSRFTSTELLKREYKPDMVRSSYSEFANDFGVSL